MKTNNFNITILVLLSVLGLYACKKTNDSTTFITATDYVNPRVGKYIIYKLDSTITQSFGKFFATFSYTIKDSVAESFTDNTGTKSFRIVRLQLDTVTKKFVPTNTFILSPKANNSVEYVENNLRYISLVDPVSVNQSWSGNNFISQSPYHSNSIINGWSFTYKDIGVPKQFGNLSFANTITVVQKDSTESRAFMLNAFSSFSKGYEIYADSLGLIYKDVMDWDYQVGISITGCKLVKPKQMGTGNDTTAIICFGAGEQNCDSLRRIPNYKIINCDTSRSEFNFSGYGVRQTIIGHN